MTGHNKHIIQAAVLSYPRQITLFDRTKPRSAILYKVLITDDRLASRKGLTSPDAHPT